VGLVAVESSKEKKSSIYNKMRQDTTNVKDSSELVNFLENFKLIYNALPSHQLTPKTKTLIN
jgi:hypothetical protein